MSDFPTQISENVNNDFVIIAGVDFREKLRIADPSKPNPDYPASSNFEFLGKEIDNISFQMDIRDKPFRDGKLIHRLDTDIGNIVKEPDYTDAPTNTADNELRGFIELHIDDLVTVEERFHENKGVLYFDLFQISDDGSEDNVKIMKGCITTENSLTEIT